MGEEIARDTGVEIAELVGDMAYGDGDTRSAVEEAGARMVARVPPVSNAGLFPKTDFVIDPQAPCATCPAGHTTTDAHAVRDHKGRSTQRLYFSIEVCGSCPLRAQCVKGGGAPSRPPLRPDLAWLMCLPGLFKALAVPEKPSWGSSGRR